jgi:hypothetical protein
VDDRDVFARPAAVGVCAVQIAIDVGEKLPVARTRPHRELVVVEIEIDAVHPEVEALAWTILRSPREQRRVGVAVPVTGEGERAGAGLLPKAGSGADVRDEGIEAAFGPYVTRAGVPTPTVGGP